MAENCLGINYQGSIHQTSTKGKGKCLRASSAYTGSGAAGGNGDDGESHDGDDDGDDDKSL